MSVLDDHYEAMGRVFAHLLKTGLSRVRLDDKDAKMILELPKASNADAARVMLDVLHWMEAEGLIRCGNRYEDLDGPYTLVNVQLTSRGIAAVQAKPTDPELGESIEKKVSSGEGLDAPTYTKIGSFIGGFLGGAIQAFS